MKTIKLNRFFGNIKRLCFNRSFEKFYENNARDGLTKNEMRIIYKVMDKGDYTHMGYQRYKDYDWIVKNVIGLKEDNHGKELTNMIQISIAESYPPQYIYKYYF